MNRTILVQNQRSERPITERSITEPNLVQFAKPNVPFSDVDCIQYSKMSVFKQVSENRKSLSRSYTLLSLIIQPMPRLGAFVSEIRIQ